MGICPRRRVTRGRADARHRAGSNLTINHRRRSQLCYCCTPHPLLDSQHSPTILAVLCGVWSSIAVGRRLHRPPRVQIRTPAPPLSSDGILRTGIAGYADTRDRSAVRRTGQHSGSLLESAAIGRGSFLTEERWSTSPLVRSVVKIVRASRERLLWQYEVRQTRRGCREHSWADGMGR